MPTLRQTIEQLPPVLRQLHHQILHDAMVTAQVYELVLPHEGPEREALELALAAYVLKAVPR